MRPQEVSDGVSDDVCVVNTGAPVQLVRSSLPVPTRQPVDLVCREVSRCRDAWVVMRPPEPIANERPGLRRAHAASWKPRLWPRWRLDARWIIDTIPRRHAAVDLARPGMANGHPADQATRKRLELSRTMWAVEHELQEPRAEGRAIDPAAVERMFDAMRGEHIAPGELEQIWCGQPGPPAERSWPAGAWCCTGIDWAQKRDSTVAAVVRCDTTPFQLVAVYRAKRRPWPMMAAQVGALLDEYQGPAGGTR